MYPVVPLPKVTWQNLEVLLVQGRNWDIPVRLHTNQNPRCVWPYMPGWAVFYTLCSAGTGCDSSGMKFCNCSSEVQHARLSADSFAGRCKRVSSFLSQATAAAQMQCLLYFETLLQCSSEQMSKSAS